MKLIFLMALTYSKYLVSISVLDFYWQISFLETAERTEPHHRS
jgi:hypothetical protein